MLSLEENELLTRVGPGTPMGELLRQYWLPFMLSTELPEQDGPPQRVRLLGENLIAFRDTANRVGLLADNCSHRGASLFYGRNEEAGLRCVYHGWKYDVDGNCVDMPNEPPESNFRDKIHHRAYPCRDLNGIIWTYMGPSSVPPPLPEIEWATVPASHRYMYPFLRECNWVQALEGDIDSSHSSFLHSVLRREDTRNEGSRITQDDRHPRFELLDTDYGVAIAAQRDAGPEQTYWRVSHFLMPIFTMFPPRGEGTETVPGHVWIPLDDEHTMVWDIRWHPTRPLTDKEAIGSLGGPWIRNPEASVTHDNQYLPPTTEPTGRWRLKANKTNDYMLDYEAQRTIRFSGIPTVPLQDQAVQESMGATVDRRIEHLGSSDSGIIRMRHCLLNAVKAFQEQGTLPPGIEDPSVYRIRSASGVLPKGVGWIEGTQEWVIARPDLPVVSK